jgi:formamidopyrimidine-DNA glycosylase
MPELPEVETIRRQLIRKIKGKKIKVVEVRLPRLVRADLKKFKQSITGAEIKDVRRRAKLLIIELSSGYCLVIHLKLTGQLIYKAQGQSSEDCPLGTVLESKHTHIIYIFTDGSQLLHNDLRQFGYVKLVPTNQLTELLEKEEKFGPEPLDKKFTLDLFKQLLTKNPRAKIKPLLMNQTFIAGIGNIYSDEILFYAGVQPTRKVQTLKPEEIKKIYQGIKKILPAAISRRGTSADKYIDTAGQEGEYLPLLKVYQREGQPCVRCGTKIKRLKLGGRSAHFCPRCQK